MMRRLTLAVLLLLLLGCARQAAAQACTFHVTAMAFGTYTGGGAALDGNATGSWTGNCSGSWTIPLGPGLGAGGSETNRFMTGPGGAEIEYGVFQVPYTTYWGNTTGTEKTGDTYTPVTFYGQIVAGQYPTPGNYTDTLSTATQSFNVSVTVLGACAISASNLSFGAYTKGLIDSTSTISVTCTSSTTYNVGLNVGTANGATVTTRKMTGPGGYVLSYSLCQNSNCSINWGNTVGTDTETGTGNGTLQTLTVYGQLHANQNVAAGTYTDTITATITY